MKEKEEDETGEREREESEELEREGKQNCFQDIPWSGAVRGKTQYSRDQK